MTDSNHSQQVPTEKPDDQKTKPGCFRNCLVAGVLLFLMFFLFIWSMFLRHRPLQISEETTYITEPLKSNGMQVDYFKALEERNHSPSMKTDRNGFRLIARALGPAVCENADPLLCRKVFAKLDLPISAEPTMTYQSPWEYLEEYLEEHDVEDKQYWYEMRVQAIHTPWTLDDLPMMETWLKENGPFLDFLGEAVQKPEFLFPMARSSEQELLFNFSSPHLGFIRGSVEDGLSVRAHYRIGTGNLDGAIDDILILHRLGRHLLSSAHTHPWTAISGRIFATRAFGIGIAGARKYPPTAEQLRRLRDQWHDAPRRIDLQETPLPARFAVLDIGQHLAAGESPKEFLDSIYACVPTYAEYPIERIGCDWNLVMKRLNDHFDRDFNQEEWDNSDRSPVRELLHPQTRSILYADMIFNTLFDTYGAFAKTAFQEQGCLENLHQIALAMLLYEREHGTLPPAWTEDADGDRLHSWRVLLLPYLNQEELYEKIRLDEPWDSEHNRRFHQADIAFYQCPSSEFDPGETTYSVVVGDKTAFGGARPRKLLEIGTYYFNTILVVEANRADPWMSPETAIAAETADVEGIHSFLSEETASSAITKKTVGNAHNYAPHAAISNGSAVDWLNEGELRQYLQGTLDPSLPPE